jgi:transposase
MIDAELRARIRRLFYAEHWKVGTIAAELGVHHDVVERAVEVERFANTARPVRPTLLDEYKDFIRQTIEQHPRLRATRLHEMVRARGYAGSIVPLRRYVATIRPRAKAEAYLRLVTLPGEQAQVDWGHFGKIQIGRALRPLSCFVMVLSWSRAMYARFTLDQTLESFLRGHICAFETLGVARSILYDNLKSVVLERQGDHVRFHPTLLDFAGHYHFAPKPCAPYRGNEKGKVERTIQYLRHAFFAARRFATAEDLNAQLADWIERVAHARPRPGDPDRRLVRDALAEERERLLPLPQNRFETDVVRGVASGKQPYTRFDLNDYSIPHHLVGKPLTLIASETEVRIVNCLGGHEFARHRRSYDRGAIVEDPAHLAELAREKRRAHELRGRDRLRASCPSADGFIEALCRRGDSIYGHVARLLKLLDHYGATELDAALTEALARGAVAAASVAHVLDQRARRRRTLPPIDVVLPDDPRVRDLRVTPHALAPYDALSNTDDPEDDHEPTL